MSKNRKIHKLEENVSDIAQKSDLNELAQKAVEQKKSITVMEVTEDKDGKVLTETKIELKCVRFNINDHTGGALILQSNTGWTGSCTRTIDKHQWKWFIDYSYCSDANNIRYAYFYVTAEMLR